MIFLGRPVVALIEIEIQKVDWAKQNQVHDVVMKAMGPADPTIVVTSNDVDDDDAGIDVSELLDAVEPYGTVVLVRFVRYYVDFNHRLQRALTSSNVIGPRHPKD